MSIINKSMVLGMVAIMTMLLCVGVSSAMSPTTTFDASDLEVFLDSVIRSQMEQFNIPNLTVSVVANGEVIMAKGYGYADLERQIPVDPEHTLFRIGSTAKLFTWTAVMQLWEQGRLDLDADINEYLDFAIPAKLANGEAAPPITLKHLLTHTPGFEDYMSEVFALSGDKLRPLGENVRARLPKRVFSPGEVIAYSNYGTSLAGYIVERVSGMPYAQYIEENIYQPLGMVNSSFRQPLPPHLAGNMTRAYRHVNGAYREGQFEFMSEPSGSMSSSATDMARFMLAHLNGGHLDGNRIFSQETARTMFEQLYTPHPRLDGMAHGFIEGAFNQRRAVFHPGGTMLFDTGLYLLPEEQVGFFISLSGGNFLVNVDIFHAFMDRYFPSERVTAPTPASGMADRSRAFVGEYHQNRMSFTTEDKLLRLMMGQIRVNMDREGYLLVTLNGETQRFVELEPGVYYNLTEARTPDYGGGFRTLVFDKDPFGRSMLVAGGPMSYSRAPWYETGAFVFGVLILSVLFVMGTLLFWGIKAIIQKIRRRKNEQLIAPRGQKLARWALMLYGLLTILFVLGFALSGEMDPVYGLPASAFGQAHPITPVLDLVPWGMAVVGLAVVFYAAQAWRKAYWRVAGRIHYTLFAAACTALLYIFVAWNAL